MQTPGQESNVLSLPKQAGPPSLEQLKQLQSEAARRGRILQLPFGEVPNEYIIKVVKDQRGGGFQWRLERIFGNSGSSKIEWEEGNLEAADIYALMARRLILPQAAAQEASDQFRTLKTEVHKPTLEGELKEMQLSNLIHSIQMNKSSGRLEVESSGGQALVYFVSGEPAHCVYNDNEGDDAFLELASLREGAFRFFKEPKTNERTINRSAEILLTEGESLANQIVALDALGVGLETYLIRNHSTMSESLFEQMVADGAGCDKELQKRFFQEVDNQSTVLEILRRIPLSKPRWVPIVFDLVNCGLCSFRDRVPDLNADARDANIDWSQVKRVESVLKRPDTGVYTYPAFLLFLEKEFFRFERFKSPFAVVTLELKVRRASDKNSAASIEPLPAQATVEVVERIARLIRRTDMLFHYETFGFAILMPETRLESARIFALRLAEILMSKPLKDDKGSYPIVASVGFASMPDSCESLGALMALARAPSR